MNILLKRNLGVFISKERARYFTDHYQSPQPGTPEIFESYTLNEFSAQIAAQLLAEPLPANELMQLQILIDSIRSTDLDHFKYLKKDISRRRSTTYMLRNFFHLLKININELEPDSKILIKKYNVLFSSPLYSSKKRKEIFQLFDSYQRLMAKNQFHDLSDYKKSFLKNPEYLENLLQGYNEIFIDEMKLPSNFFNDNKNKSAAGLHFYTNAAEKSLVETISNKAREPLKWWDREDAKEAGNHHTLIYDEKVSENELAARFVHNLLTREKIPAEKILLISHSVENFSILESIFSRYGIPLFFSRGKKIGQLPVYPQIQKIVREFIASKKSTALLNKSLSDLAKLYDQYIHYSKKSSNPFFFYASMENCKAINETSALLTDLYYREIYMEFEWIDDYLREKTITVKKDGILVQELNQTPGIMYDHVILTGLDKVFPATSDNIFFLPIHKKELFYQNDSFQLSRFYIRNLKSAAKNLTVLFPANSSTEGYLNAIWEILFSGERFSKTILGNQAYQRISDKNFVKKNDLERSNLGNHRENYMSRMFNPKGGPLDGLLNSDFSAALKNRFSASRYSTYMSCPRKFWYTFMLGLKKINLTEEPEAMDAGSILHATFEAFMTELHEDASNEKIKDDGFYLNRLSELLHLKIYDNARENDHLSAKGELPVEYLLLEKRFLKNLKQLPQPAEPEDLIKSDNILQNFYLREKMHGFGKKFWGAEKHLSDLLKQNPFFIEFSNKQKIEITGIIDRIDCTVKEDHISINIYDYKPMTKMETSKLENKWKDNKDFQLFLYILAVYKAIESGYAICEQARKKHLKISAALLSYKKENKNFTQADDPFRFMKIEYDHKREIFIGYPGTKNRKTVKCEKHLQKVYDNIENVFQQIQNGLFPYTTDIKDCEYCDFRLICRRDLRNNITPGTFDQSTHNAEFKEEESCFKIN